MGRKRAWYETASQRGMIPELGLTGCDLHRVLLSDQLSWLQASRYRHEESDRVASGAGWWPGRITYSKTV